MVLRRILQVPPGRAVAIAVDCGLASACWGITRCANHQPQRIRDSSVTVGADWELLEEIDFTRLHKLNFNVQEPEEL